MKAKVLLLNCLLILICIFIFGCNNENIEISIDYQDEITIDESITLNVSSTKSNDIIEIENLTPDIIKINDNIITGIEEGLGQIKISNTTGIIKYIEIIVNDKPIPESLNIVLNTDKVVMNKVYNFEIITEPSNAKIDLKLSYNSNYIDINLETKEIVFKDTGIQKITFYSKDNLKAKSVLSVDVDFNPDIEYYELLYIGNSLTKHTVYDVPAMVEAMMKVENIAAKITVDSTTPQWIIDHKSSFKSLITKRKYTHVILQEKSQGMITDYQKFENAVLEFNGLIKANGAKTVLYQTWGYKNGFNEFTKYEMYLKVKEQYEKVGNKINATIFKTGDAFIKYEEIYNEVSLYSDNNHGSIYGGYLSACVHFATLTGRKASNNSYIHPDIEETIAKHLKEIADMIVFG